MLKMEIFFVSISVIVDLTGTIVIGEAWNKKGVNPMRKKQIGSIWDVFVYTVYSGYSGLYCFSETHKESF